MAGVSMRVISTEGSTTETVKTQQPRSPSRLDVVWHPFEVEDEWLDRSGKFVSPLASAGPVGVWSRYSY